MNKLIIKLAVAAALVVGCGMAGTAFADTTPKNGATQGLKNGLKYGAKNGLKDGKKYGDKKLSDKLLDSLEVLLRAATGDLDPESQSGDGESD